MSDTFETKGPGQKTSLGDKDHEPTRKLVAMDGTVTGELRISKDGAGTKATYTLQGDKAGALGGSFHLNSEESTLDIESQLNLAEERILNRKQIENIFS